MTLKSRNFLKVATTVVVCLFIGKAIDFVVNRNMINAHVATPFHSSDDECGRRKKFNEFYACLNLKKSYPSVNLDSIRLEELDQNNAILHNSLPEDNPLYFDIHVPGASKSVLPDSKVFLDGYVILKIKRKYQFPIPSNKFEKIEAGHGKGFFLAVRKGWFRRLVNAIKPPVSSKNYPFTEYEAFVEEQNLTLQGKLWRDIFENTNFITGDTNSRLFNNREFYRIERNPSEEHFTIYTTFLIHFQQTEFGFVDKSFFLDQPKNNNLAEISIEAAFLTENQSKKPVLDRFVYVEP